MKKKNSKCDYTQHRNEKLMAEFKARIGCGDGSTIDSIFPLIARDAKAPRFYINEDRAYSLIRNFKKSGRWPDNMTANKRRMICDILERVERTMAFRRNITLKDAVYEVVNSEAPSFYLTPRSIRTMLYASLAG